MGKQLPEDPVHLPSLPVSDHSNELPMLKVLPQALLWASGEAFPLEEQRLNTAEDLNQRPQKSHSSGRDLGSICPIRVISSLTLTEESPDFPGKTMAD